MISMSAEYVLSLRQRRAAVLLCPLAFMLLTSSGCSDDDKSGVAPCISDASVGPITTSDAGGAEASLLLGSWVYRSFYNENLSFVRSSADPPATALSLLWAEGKITFDARQADGTYTGTITFAPGVALALTARLEPDGVGGPLALRVEGVGVAGTATAAWRYSLAGWLVEDWNVSPAPQRTSLVGSVVNSVEIAGPPPIGAALGTTGSFQMLKLP
jgi:hypothetical protein